MSNWLRDTISEIIGNDKAAIAAVSAIDNEFYHRWLSSLEFEDRLIPIKDTNYTYVRAYGNPLQICTPRYVYDLDDRDDIVKAFDQMILDLQVWTRRWLIENNYGPLFYVPPRVFIKREGYKVEMFAWMDVVAVRTELFHANQPRITYCGSTVTPVERSECVGNS